MAYGMYQHSHAQGLTVVEVMVALGIFTMLSMAGYQTFVWTANALSESSLSHRALWLASEGVEAAYAIGRDDFAALQPGSWGITDASGTWQFSGSSDVTDGVFTRTVSLTALDPQTVVADAAVEWEYKGQTYTKSLERRITNWHRTEQTEADQVTIDTSGAYIDFDTLRGVTLATTNGSSLVVTSISISWNKNMRTLTQVMSPFGVVVYGPAEVSSGDTITLPVGLSLTSVSQELSFVFDKNMTNTDFTINFFFGDGSTQTVTLTNI